MKLLSIAPTTPGNPPSVRKLSVVSLNCVPINITVLLGENIYDNVYFRKKINSYYLAI